MIGLLKRTVGEKYTKIYENNRKAERNVIKQNGEFKNSHPFEWIIFEFYKCFKICDAKVSNNWYSSK